MSTGSRQKTFSLLSEDSSATGALAFLFAASAPAGPDHTNTPKLTIVIAFKLIRTSTLSFRCPPSKGDCGQALGSTLAMQLPGICTHSYMKNSRYQLIVQPGDGVVPLVR